MTEMISTTRAIMRYHLTRTWTRRHESAGQCESVRSNLRGQRACRESERAGVAHRMVEVGIGRA